MSAAALALVTSLAYGASNFLGPRLSRGAPTYVVLVAGQAVALLVSGVLFVATASSIGTTAAAASVITGVANAAGLICFYRAATYGPLSLVVPIGALSALLPVSAGLLSGERLEAQQALGTALAIGGVALAARRPAGGGALDYDRGRAIRWALLSCLGFGSFLTVIAPASEDGVYGAVAVSRAALLVCLVLVASRLREPLRAPARTLPLLAIPGVLLFIGTLAYSEATRTGDLSVVSVLGSLFPVVTVALAFVFAGERLRAPQYLGVALALTGTVLVG